MLKDYYVFDTETGTRFKDGSIQWKLNGQPESFQFGVVYGYNFSKVIYSVEDFKQEFLLPKYKGKKVFAHNLEYDGSAIYGNIYNVDPTAIFNGKLICFTNGNCMFADSTNIFGKIKLAQVGEMLGIKKPDLGDSSMFSPKGIGPAEINRCYTDCEIVYESLMLIFKAAGDIKITQASLSMTYFRRFHQPFDIEYNENTNYFFDSYFGGRTEAFKLGPTNSTVIDVNSMYPYAMQKVTFPNPKYFKTESPAKPDSIKFISYFKNQILNTYEGLAYCTVNHKSTSYGYLPVKHKGKDGSTKLIFPVGRFTGCWNFPEIRFALERGVIEIEQITKVVYSQSMTSPFLSYIDTLYDEKLKAEREGNDFERHRVKIFMNSLYGKFAQRISEDSIYIDDIDKHYDYIREMQREGRLLKLSMFNSVRNDAMLILTSSRGFTCAHSIPSFASYITSFCRVLLLKKMLELHGKKVVYCDTDSIFFEVNTGLDSEFHLGGWKLEDKIVTEINGLKNYRYQYIDKKGNLVKKNRIKGVPEKAELLETDKEGLNTYYYENLLKTKEALRRGLTPMTLIKRIKKIKGTYDKRVVLENGETKPIHL